MGLCSSKNEVDWMAAAETKMEKRRSEGTENAGSNSSPNKQGLTRKIASQAKESAKSGADQLHRNVFAKPLKLLDSYRPPVYHKSQEAEAFIKKAMKQNFVFANMSEKEEKSLIKAFEQVSVDRGATIISQGDEGDYFYVLQSGKVNFEVNGEVVGCAKAGHSFGELSLLYTSPRAASCIAIEDCVLWRLDQTTFRYILQLQAVQGESSKQHIVKSIDFLKELDEADLNKLAKVLTPRPFKDGEQLVKKGEVGETFFIVDEGSVKVTDIEVGDAKFEDRVLDPGDYFGERALITKEPRVANVYGKSDGVCLTIDSTTFRNVLGSLNDLVLKAQDKRLLSGIKCVAHTDLDSAELSALADLVTDKRYKAGTNIIVEGEITYATLYLVRDGQINVTSKENTKFRGSFIKGGFVGEDQLQADIRGDDGDTRLFAKYTMTAVHDTTLGQLSLLEARDVVDTTRIGHDKPRLQSVIDTSIKLESLKKHRILGEGTFGQVWLVSRVSAQGRKTAYALKIQSKFDLIQYEQATGVVNEMKIMSTLNNQFIIRLSATFQDSSRVYLLLKLVQGGELFSVLHTNDSDGVTESAAKFYAAGILEGLSYMHRRNIIYRDLKPENVLIDKDGFPVIVDLGFAKVVKNKTFTLRGTPLYIAPEVVMNRGHGKGADHWSLGVLIYEMISGYTPFYEDGMDQITLFKAIIKGDYSFPPSGIMSPAAQGIVARLLVTDPNARLGSLAKGVKELFREPWFDDLDFKKYRKREIEAPWKPEVSDGLDVSNFDSYDHAEDKSKVRDPKLTAKEQSIFKDF